MNSLQSKFAHGDRSVCDFSPQGLYNIGFEHVPDNTFDDPEAEVLINALPLLAREARTHDKSQPCVICGNPGHSFDDCPALQNSAEVRTAYIKI